MTQGTERPEQVQYTASLLANKIAQELLSKLSNSVGGMIDEVIEEAVGWISKPSQPDDQVQEMPDQEEPVDRAAFKERVTGLIEGITFWGAPLFSESTNSNWKLMLEVDQKDTAGRLYLQIGHWRPDARTGVRSWGSSRKQYLSEHMTDGEIVRQVLGLLLGYQEHEVREGFRYQGKQIFGPHIALDALVEVADRVERRA